MSADAQRLLELVRAGATDAALEAEGYTWFEITAAKAQAARQKVRRPATG